MVGKFAYFQILGLPVVMYLGISALTLFLTAAVLGVLMHKGIVAIPVKTHKLFAVSGIIVALIHGTLAMLSYFGL